MGDIQTDPSEIWTEINERDDILLSSTGRVKRTTEVFITSAGLHYEKSDGTHSTIAINKLYRLYFPNADKKAEEEWKEIDERPDTCISSRGRVKTINELFLKGRCIKHTVDGKDVQTNISTLLKRYFPPKDLEGEQWKTIPGFTRYVISSEGRVKNKETNDILKPHLKNKYLYIGLYNDERKKQISPRLNRLMAAAFLQPVKDKSFVNHKNGDKSCNKLENLEYTTSSENRIHALDTGLSDSRRKVHKIDMTTNKIIQTYNSVTDAVEDVGARSHSLILACQNKTGYKGFYWKYDKEKPKKVYEEIEGEEWKQYKNTMYEVSTKGRVKNKERGKFLSFKYLDNDNKRAYVTLSINKKGKHFSVARLVALVYIDNPHNLPDVDHIDKDPSNNCVENLRWLTKSDNIRHSKAKKIDQLTLDGQFVKRWDAISDLKRSGFHVYYALVGKVKNYKGYVWKYAD